MSVMFCWGLLQLYTIQNLKNKKSFSEKHFPLQNGNKTVEKCKLWQWL